MYCVNYLPLLPLISRKLFCMLTDNCPLVINNHTFLPIFLSFPSFLLTNKRTLSFFCQTLHFFCTKKNKIPQKAVPLPKFIQHY